MLIKIFFINYEDIVGVIVYRKNANTPVKSYFVTDDTILFKLRTLSLRHGKNLKVILEVDTKDYVKNFKWEIFKND